MRTQHQLTHETDLPIRSRWRAGICLALLTACAVVASGCNILGPAMVLVHGPPKTYAAVELDATKSHVIFIDDMRSSFPKRSLRTIMAQSAEETMLNQGALPPGNLISAAAAHRVAASESNAEKLSIVEVGRRVDADVVIYVLIDGFFITRDGQTKLPTAAARVKILDARNNVRLWPAQDEGHSLILQPRQQEGNLPPDLASRSAIEADLARRFGVALAQMFYTHESRENVVGN